MDQQIFKQKRSEIIKDKKIKKPKNIKKKDFRNSKHNRAYDNFTPWNKLRVRYHNNDDWYYDLKWLCPKGPNNTYRNYQMKISKLHVEIEEKNNSLEKFYEILDNRHGTIKSIVPNKKFNFSKYLKQYLNSAAIKDVSYAFYLCYLTDF